MKAENVLEVNCCFVLVLELSAEHNYYPSWDQASSRTRTMNLGHQADVMISQKNTTSRNS